MKGQRVTGKVLLLQIQGDAQSLLRFLFGSGWEASSDTANNFSASALSYLYTHGGPCPRALGMTGSHPAGSNRLLSRIHANLLGAGLSIPDFLI